MKRTKDNSPRSRSSKEHRPGADSNNNRTNISNNFDFIEPCDIDDEVDSLDSLEVKNWRYHLTSKKF